MTSPRSRAIEKIGQRRQCESDSDQELTPGRRFGVRVFSRSVMQNMLPKDVFASVLNAIEGKEKILPKHADAIAVAMKEWAIEQGATHYTHWFQPLTGATAEKHDAFIEWLSPDKVIEKFSGKQLIQGEPDASSFPSGGLRSTYEARGYTGWDPSSPPFVWRAGDGVTLCIPSVFFSWTGDVLDSKIPLLRSEKKIRAATLRLLAMTGIAASSVHSTIGMEQEYFVIDRALRDLRPDLVLTGATLCGASSPKGQELQDHYFGTVKDRVLNFMHHFEVDALELGIPVKTRHNEVAPAQHEVAPVFEKATLAVDHNILLMELMRQVAHKHDLACLLHEKPFAALNGSGKHCNWSLATDTGINLLDPTETPENTLHFLILLTAILDAVHRHPKLLRATVGSHGNDHRLGGHEAPPAILSVYVGNALETLIDNILAERPHVSNGEKDKYDFGLLELPHLTKDNTDRNRTSPFAFTGNKFEFRAPGSSQSAAFFATTMNIIVAESLNEMLDAIEQRGGDKKAAIMEVLREFLERSRAVQFSGDNYSQEWLEEAKRRGLPNIAQSVDAFDALTEEATVRVFKGILNAHELASRQEILTEIYSTSINIEASTLAEIFRTQVLPVAWKQQKLQARSLNQARKVLEGRFSGQEALLKDLSGLIEEGIAAVDALQKACQEANGLDVAERGQAFGKQVLPQCAALRRVIDMLEECVDDELWPLPKYRELLFIL